MQSLSHKSHYLRIFLTEALMLILTYECKVEGCSLPIFFYFVSIQRRSDTHVSAPRHSNCMYQELHAFKNLTLKKSAKNQSLKLSKGPEWPELLFKRNSRSRIWRYAYPSRRPCPRLRTSYQRPQVSRSQCFLLCTFQFAIRQASKLTGQEWCKSL